MHDHDLVTFTTRLLELQSFDRENSRVPELIADTLRTYGAEPAILERNGIRNVVACTSDERCLVLNGHWDTVLPNEVFEREVLSAKVEGETLWGLGACDMKSGVAAQCAAFITCLRRGIPGVVLSVVGDEELGGLNGTGFLVEEGYSAPYVILGEPTSLRLSLGQKGGLQVRVRSRGRLAHGAYPHRGENAILNMVRFFDKLLEKYPIPESGAASSEVFGQTTASIGVIRGGESVNVVPDRCEANIDMRIPPHVAVEEVQDTLRQMAEDIGARIEFNFLGYGWQLDKAGRIFEVSKAAVEEVTGELADFVQKMGTNDGKYYVFHGAQITNVGPGDNKLSHTAHERVPLRQLFQARDIYVRMAEMLAA